VNGAATVDDYERADQLVFDLDPGEGVPWEFVIETAVAMRRVLEAEGLESWPKTTGGKGLHVMAAADGALRDSRRPRQAGPGASSSITSATRRGTTAVGTYSPRARPGVPIAAPVTWRQVENGVRPDAYSMAWPIGRASVRNK
jgi:bifunctional non-homologous end joining protein LigD